MTEVTKEQLRKAATKRRQADQHYRELVLAAKTQGWSNTEIARQVSVSEAAIRMYVSRHQLAKVG